MNYLIDTHVLVWHGAGDEKLLNQKHFTFLPPNFRHFDALSNLPPHHHDPFDRMMIAQAIADDLTIITHDAKFPFYPVRLEKF